MELYTCVLLPLYLLSDPPPQTKCTVRSCEGGGGVMNCTVDHNSAGVLHSVSDQI
jgi:hypothetical protein